MGRWVWQNDDGSIEVPPTDLANHLSQSVNGYRQQQQSSQAKVSNTGAYVPNGGTWEQNMTQLGQQLSPQQRQPVAYWNPNTNVVYAGGMPTQMPQVVPIGYGYSQGYGTAPLVYDMAKGQYVGGSINQFGPTGNAAVPMATETTITPIASNNTNSNNQSKQITDVVQKEEQDAIKNSTYNVDNPGNMGINIDDDSYTEPIKPARVEYTQEEFENLSDTNPSALQNYVDFFSQMKKQNPERFGNMNILEFVNFYRRHGYLR